MKTSCGSGKTTAAIIAHDLRQSGACINKSREAPVQYELCESNWVMCHEHYEKDKQSLQRE